MFYFYRRCNNPCRKKLPFNNNTRKFKEYCRVCNHSLFMHELTENLRQENYAITTSSVMWGRSCQTPGILSPVCLCLRDVDKRAELHSAWRDPHIPHQCVWSMDLWLLLHSTDTTKQWYFIKLQNFLSLLVKTIFQCSMFGVWITNQINGGALTYIYMNM